MNDLFKLLIVEDDRVMADLMKKLLEKWGFHAIICEDLENIMGEIAAAVPHIILLDINLPVFDGFYWCKKIREISHVPIIFVSSRDSNMDVIMAINNGGDDYIQKPFDSQVLVAKLQAIIRRTYEYSSKETQFIVNNQVMLNLNDSMIHYGNQGVELTKNEFKIIKTLMENKGSIVSRESLMRQLWNDDIYVNENTLTVNINRLRKSLEAVGVNDFITTKKGLGYIVQ